MARPYQIERDGKQLFVASEIGEALLGAAYLRMLNEGLLDLMFWKTPPSLREFLNWACGRKDVVVIGGFVEDPVRGVRLAALGWVREIQERLGRKYADTGELVFREFQTRRISGALVKLMLDYAFQEVGVEALYGLTPSKNIAAVRFMRHVGFQSTVEVPQLCCLRGEICGGVVSWLTRQQWQAARNAEVSA
jgi:RimJ/RimL family protein N-acetyltransferase